MAVQTISELKGPGSRSLSWGIDSGRERTKKWRVETNDATDGPEVVRAAFGAKFGDRYASLVNSGEVDRFAFMNNLDVQEEAEDGLSWVVTLTYGPRDAQQLGDPQDPLSWPIDVSWDLRDQEIVLERDVVGTPVVNTAGDPFDPPVLVPDPRLTMTVVRNEATYNLALVQAYKNAINSDSFAGFDPYFCKVLNISSRSTWSQDIGWYYVVTYQFEFASPKLNDVTVGWRKKILSLGYRAISAVSGDRYHVTLKGVPVSSPMLLDKSGFLLGVNADPYWIDVTAYPELPFARFSFDPGAISGNRTGLDYSPHPKS